MAPGLPYAIAHQWAYPERQCIAFVGDGGFAMLMAEFETAARYDLPIKVFVNNNGSLGQILWEQMVLGYPEFGVRFQEYSNYRAVGDGLAVASASRWRSRATSMRRSREALAHPGPSARGRAGQPRRASDAGQGQPRPGAQVRRGVPARASPTRRPSPARCSGTRSRSSAREHAGHPR